jgi:aspartyl-tRNA(Asn)/glutamyl-tRNA(Gln) amidotransferase subunit C
MAKTSKYWKIDKDLIKHVSGIARLELTEEEIKKFTKQLEDVLTTFKKIDEVDTEKVKPSFHAIELKNIMREDEAKPWKWKPLANTKHKEKKYFKGPRIV